MDLLDEILVTSKNEFILAYKSIELFDLRLKRRNSTFSVCGLFPLNCTFIYTMIAGMASYMIYLVQFSQIKTKKQ
ncbi:unnamed protein product [Tenebrio molitor]|nr:unnamed protein product [Tenebrio molitor]